MEEYKTIITNSDLPHEYIYDDDKLVSHTPESELNLGDILHSAAFAAEAKPKTKRLSRAIPPYPHAARLKNGVRVYEYSEPRKQSYRSNLWKEAYSILHQRLDIAETVAGEENLRTQIHPCLHRIKGLLNPDTCLMCPRCQKPILSTKVLRLA
ncbi:uncharacterized protein LOC122611855 [Drosophila teissieri]|uniref:uncharacterized protein LOC122611855 n=1 Tax=Drosophila teissieri TaxID=7243 RepID=UPI001CBA1F39|nr:uncharacterized protein LOC122611855 [Drosophila teissieri]